MKKIVAFVNHQSGSVPKDGSEALERVLSDLGYTAEIISFEEGDVKATLQRAIDQSPDYLIAWGGDGSINCALTASGSDGPPVLALPGGTMNLRLRASPPGFNIVDIDADGLSVAPYTYNHETFEPLPSARLDWTEAPDPG